jgi:photosystem II stability/assembly factor-like uncharacterized protein
VTATVIALRQPAPAPFATPAALGRWKWWFTPLEEKTPFRPAATGANLSSIFFLPGQTRLGWATGGFGTILHTEDYGKSWQVQSSGAVEGLSSVTFVTPQSGFAVGMSGTILHTENGGANWQAQSGGTREILSCVTFVTPQSGWAVGANGTILHTEDGGRSWQAQSSSTVEILRSVAFATPQSGWVVGWKGTILHTETAALAIS